MILFAQLYVLGVIGTLLHNRRHPEIRYSLASLLWRHPAKLILRLSVKPREAEVIAGLDSMLGAETAIDFEHVLRVAGNA